MVLALIALLVLACIMPVGMPAGAAESMQIETIIEPQYDDAGAFSEGLAAVRQGEYYGYINEQGETVIPFQYSYALSFNDGIALVSKIDADLAPEYPRMYILKKDGTEIPLSHYGYAFLADGSIEAGFDKPVPLQYRNSSGELPDEMNNRCQSGVVIALGTAYTLDGTIIEPKNYDGFAESYQTYQVIAPAVNGVIPCKAMYYNKEAAGQCFYMDRSGNVTQIFPSGDDPEISLFYDHVMAPDPNTGHIVVTFGFRGDSDNVRLIWPLEDADDEPGASWFMDSFRYRGDGAVFSHGYMPVRMWDGNGTWMLMKSEMDYSFGLIEEPEETPNHWMGMGLTFEACGSFGDGEGDIFCPVKVDGRWKYVSTKGKFYEVEAPDGGTANLAMAGQFHNGIAPVYDSDSGKAYLISTSLDNNILTMIEGSDALSADVYFPDFRPGMDTDEIGLTGDVEEIVVITDDNGKKGYARLNFQDAGFQDVDAAAYYAKAVQWAVDHDPQITNGTSPTTFSPDATCTRAQVVTFLWRAMGEPEPVSTVNPFADVNPDAYYYKAVLWAVEKKITAGTSASTFSPNAGCTRGQVATFLWRTQGEPAANGSNPFTDVSTNAYYYNAVLWAVANEVTNGTSETTFSPEATCTRGQIVTFLYRALHQSIDR